MQPPRPPPMMAPPGMGGPPMGYMPGPGGPPPRPPQKKPMMDGVAGGPPAKRAKTEDDLMPEAEFLSRNTGPVTFKVTVPKQADKPEWKLNGQTLTFTLPLRDNVSYLLSLLPIDIGFITFKQDWCFLCYFVLRRM